MRIVYGDRCTPPLRTRRTRKTRANNIPHSRAGSIRGHARAHTLCDARPARTLRDWARLAEPSILVGQRGRMERRALALRLPHTNCAMVKRVRKDTPRVIPTGLPANRQQPYQSSVKNTKHQIPNISNKGQTRNKLLEQWVHLTNHTAGHSRPVNDVLDRVSNEIKPQAAPSVHSRGTG